MRGGGGERRRWASGRTREFEFGISIRSEFGPIPPPKWAQHRSRVRIRGPSSAEFEFAVSAFGRIGPRARRPTRFAPSPSRQDSLPLWPFVGPPAAVREVHWATDAQPQWHALVAGLRGCV